MNAQWTRVVVMVVTAAMLQGCAELGFIALSTAASQGVSYTLDSIAYKTFTSSVEGLEAATLRTLDRMDIKVTKNEPRIDKDEKNEAGTKKGGKDEAGDTKAAKTEARDRGRAIAATAGDRTVEIELDRITERTSRIRVVVKQGWLFRDRATATEIILQIAQVFDDNPALARLGKPKPAARVNGRTAAGGANK